MVISAQSVQGIINIQHALNVFSTLNLFAYLNPYDGCAKNETRFDYIIVGGGTSGCVIANRLSANKHLNILLIEAGGDFPIEAVFPRFILYNKQSRYDWNYTSIDDGYTQQCKQGNNFQPTIGKVLGGSSSVDYSLYSQGDARDYEEWADITGEPAWRFENVQRLFKKIERFDDIQLQNSKDSIYHGFNGKVGITKENRPQITKYINAFGDVGHKLVNDINHGHRLGFTKGVFYYDKKMRQNSAYAYLYPVRNRTNLVVLKSAHVTQILFHKKTATGVKVLLSNNKTFIFKANREIIVTAGPFNTPKLLQLSGVGPKKLLKKFGINVISDVPVGENYQNHVATFVNINTQKATAPILEQNNDPRVFSSPIFYGYVAMNKTQEYPDYRAVGFVVTRLPPVPLTQFPPFVYRFKHNMNDYVYEQLYGKEFFVALVEALKPKSRGTVHIRSRNPLDSPVIKTGFFSHEDDMKAMIRYVKDYLRVLNSEYLKQVGAVFFDASGDRCSEYSRGSDDYWKCFILCLMVPTSHHSGTAAMGAVVDGRLRVKGVKRLRVADASIMPTLVSGSTTVPTMMIGENAAEMIKNDYSDNYDSTQEQVDY